MLFRSKDPPAQGALGDDQQAGEEPEEGHGQAGELHDPGEVQQGHGSQGDDAVYEQDVKYFPGVLLQALGVVQPQDVVNEDGEQGAASGQSIIRRGE